MKTLVTGGAGFIGSHLVEALLKRGDEVRVLDNLSTGHEENLDKTKEEIEFIKGSITDLKVCRKACIGMDIVFHEAAIPSVPRSVKDPVTSHQANATGTLNMLVAARDAGVRRLVYAASSSAYGDTPTLPKVETMRATPMSPYALQKYIGEVYCRQFFDLFGFETVSLRYFNIFGPRQDPNSPYGGVIPKFMSALLGGNAPTIFGDGGQTRDFTYVENAVNANLLASRADPRACGKVFNIACGTRYSLVELLSTVQEITGINIPPRHEPPRAGDVRDSLADISLAGKFLGYEVKVGFEEGLKRTVEWFRS
ncbi:MAG: SDR family oxidoreductase [Deltaproteobacteria bacterium]|nr:SDR family oxidoreductase [Deltaproteobacteria bacterium]